ncbi:glycerophosphodiester phosphodiesterase family protein [Glaciihabitans sp. UYNi722]|uniref:glycerophosphodiester phosphodiesterase family protein n=1 Tax=Glaciihabitans sp. UYNi722 TaxID=3156344 RepID=UPI00339B0FB1
MTSLPLVIAHRGASGYRPEHTRAAYELASEQGADAVEPDIVVSKDRVLVLRHENEISETTDVAAHREFADRRTTKYIDGQKLTGWFTEDFTWAELSTLRATERLPKIRTANVRHTGDQGILRLTDLLDLLDGADRRIGMVAEIKHATYFESIGMPLDELFAGELSAAGWESDGRLTIECFEKTVLLKIRERGIRGGLVFLVEASGAPADQVAARGKEALQYADYLTREGLEELAATVDGVSVNKHILQKPGGADVVSLAHEAGLSVFCWTLRAENSFLAKGLRHGSTPGDFGDWRREFESIMRMGVDGVFADQPDLAIEVRDSL